VALRLVRVVVAEVKAGPSISSSLGCESFVRY
jgi:hypothetical protein